VKEIKAARHEKEPRGGPKSRKIKKSLSSSGEVSKPAKLTFQGRFSSGGNMVRGGGPPGNKETYKEKKLLALWPGIDGVSVSRLAKKGEFRKKGRKEGEKVRRI